MQVVQTHKRRSPSLGLKGTRVQGRRSGKEGPHPLLVLTIDTTVGCEPQG
jgi:hypothetical protein